MCRSEGEWLVRRGAVVEAEDAEREEGWGVVGSHVTRLHGTPWRAQLEHGLSSSHCRWLSSCLGWTGPCAPGGGLAGVPSHGEPCTVCSPVVTCQAHLAYAAANDGPGMARTLKRGEVIGVCAGDEWTGGEVEYGLFVPEAWHWRGAAQPVAGALGCDT